MYVSSKAKTISLLMLLFISFIVFSIYSFKYKTPLSKDKNIESRYEITNVKYSNYGKLQEEIKSNPQIHKSYIEKTKYYLDGAPLITLSGLEDFVAINPIKELVSGRLPKNENEVIVSQMLLNSDYLKVDSEGNITIEMGDYYCEYYYSEFINFCGGNTSVENKQSLTFKVVGVYGGFSETKIYTVLNKSSLDEDDLINVILDVDKDIELSKLQELLNKYTEDDYSEYNKINDIIYNVGGAEYDISNFILDTNIVTIILILLTIASVVLVIYKLKSLKVILTIFACILVLSSLEGYNIITTRNMIRSAYFGYNDEIVETVILENNKDYETLKNNDIDITNKENKLYNVKFKNIDDINNYYSVIKKKNINTLSIRTKLSMWTNEFSLLKNYHLINKLFISLITYMVFTIFTSLTIYVLKQKESE